MNNYIYILMNGSVKRLVAAGFSEAAAVHYLAGLDAAIADYLSCNPASTLKSLHHTHLHSQHQLIDTLKAEAMSAETATHTSLQTDHDLLITAIQRTRQELGEAVAALEQTTRLDISLERQRAAEMARDMMAAVGEATKRGEQGIVEVRVGMGLEGRKAMWTMSALFGVALAVILVL